MIPVLVAMQIGWTVTPDAADQVGAFTAFGVEACNRGQSPVVVTPAEFQAELLRWKVSPATNAQLLAAGERRDGMSAQRKWLLALEAAGYLTSSFVLGDQIKVKETWAKAAIGLVGPGLRFATTAIKAPRFELPKDGPRRVALAPGECAQASIYGVRQ